MRVLLPIDGSQASQATLAWAVQFLDPQCAEPYLVHVIPWSMDALVHEEEIEEANQILSRERAFLEIHRFNIVEAKYLLGAASAKICEYADEINVDQIIIGSHGKTRLKKVLMGSVSKGVFECARQPVLLLNNITKSILEIPSPDQVRLKQAEEYFRKVLLPIDGSPGSWRTLEWAVDFLDKSRHEIHLLHVYSYSPEGGYRYPEFQESEKALVEAEAFMHQNGFQVVTKCLTGFPATATCDYAQEKGIDEIIIGSQGEQGIGKFLMGSVTQGVLKCAKKPVIVLNNTEKAILKRVNPHKKTGRS